MTAPDTDNSSLALERLRALLRDLPPTGEARLPTERALAGQLGISRRSVRRALEVLEADGEVWRRQGSGTFAGPRPRPIPIGDPHPLDPLEVIEARLAIEPQIARLAALRAEPAAISQIARIVARIEQATDADERELWDSALHREIACAAGNGIFVQILDALDKARLDDRWRALRERARAGGHVSAYQQHHRAICAAITTHDCNAA